MTGAEQDIKIAQTKQEVDDFKAIIENFIGEMRDRDNKRDADIRELRERHDADMKELRKQREEDRKQYETDMKEMQKKQDAIANELRTEIREANRDIRTFTIASAVGIGAIVISVIVFVVNSIFTSAQTSEKIQYQPPPTQTQSYSGGEENDKSAS